MFKKTKILIYMAILCVSLLSLISCSSECIHKYYVKKTVDATCEKEGYNEYKCSECGDKYKVPISVKEHTPGEAPTFDSSQVCVDCGIVLADAVDYMPYRGNDLLVNLNYGYSDNYVVTDVTTQIQDRYVPPSFPYVDKNGNPCYLNLSVPVQDFFKHSINSVLPASTKDGKSYSTDSGFKVAFSFNITDKDVASIYAWNTGLSEQFKGKDYSLLRIVGEYQADAPYDKVYELVDFSDCYIEMMQKTEDGYRTVKRIDSDEAWASIIESRSIVVADDNQRLFCEPGTYRILFKYNMTWITNPSSGVYESSDTEKHNSIYPYGKVNDQYEFFDVVVTEKRANVLLPESAEASDLGFFCQLRAETNGEDAAFIPDKSTLSFENNVVFKLGAKVDMTKTDYYFNHHIIKSFNFKLSYYDPATDSYKEYKTRDLMPDISRSVVYGDEIALDFGRDSSLRDKDCRITITYSYLNETTGETVVEAQNYYYTLSW